MRMMKGIKFEIEIVCEAELSTEDATKWVEDAMDVFCEFESWRVKPVQTFEAIMHDEDMATA
jgi:hypothetical protein